MSLPMRECGLKLVSHEAPRFNHGVTPHAGVWIETDPFTVASPTTQVTPHAGVWIETAP